VPLAANFTAPYALWLERSKFGRQSKRALFTRSESLAEPRVILIEPYDPRRKTVVLIHGLASSPRAWVDLANELLADAEVRSQFQIWHVFYGTSAPIPWNREAIRAALEATLSRLDPERDDPATRDLVVVGHSMGGVIARLLVVESGDALWQALLGHEPEVEERERLAVLSPYLDLEPMPEVGRLVLMASPHRGAPLAGRWLGRVGARLVRLPLSLAASATEAVSTLLDVAPDAPVRVPKHPDAIRSLSDRLPYLETAAQLSVAPWVTYHSIVACAEAVASIPECDDGLVPYSSAHLDGAASELVVTHGHSVQETPQAILELRRILRLHLEELARRGHDCGSKPSERREAAPTPSRASR
jgi:pimeloyl-ACP methyl ester carboxylesterase